MRKKGGGFGCLPFSFFATGITRRMNRIGIVVGGTTAKAALVNSEGRVLARHHFPTGYHLTGESLLAGCVEAVDRLTRDSAAASLGIAAPGFRRADGEGVENVSNLPGLDDFPIRTRCREALGLPVVVDNDANAAAYGEWAFGARAECRRLLVMTLGTGIGGAMVVDGALLRISGGCLGDPGHLILDPDGPRCACGGRGCAETLAAVPAIVRAAAAAMPERAIHTLADVTAAAGDGDPKATEVLASAGRRLGTLLTSLIHVLTPDRILLGGGGMDAAGHYLIPAAKQAIADCVQPFLAAGLTIDRAALGNDAGAVGAAALSSTNS